MYQIFVGYMQVAQSGFNVVMPYPLAQVFFTGVGVEHGLCAAMASPTANVIAMIASLYSV